MFPKLCVTPWHGSLSGEAIPSSSEFSFLPSDPYLDAPFGNNHGRRRPFLQLLRRKFCCARSLRCVRGATSGTSKQLSPSHRCHRNVCFFCCCKSSAGFCRGAAVSGPAGAAGSGPAGAAGLGSATANRTALLLFWKIDNRLETSDKHATEAQHALQHTPFLRCERQRPGMPLTCSTMRSRIMGSG